jgi:transposase-like protein
MTTPQEDGFLRLKKAIFERALGGELTHHLGYEKGEAKPVGRTNHRNGTSRKRIQRCTPGTYPCLP